jgi:hypothetical protein
MCANDIICDVFFWLGAFPDWIEISFKSRTMASIPFADEHHASSSMLTANFLQGTKGTPRAFLAPDVWRITESQSSVHNDGVTDVKDHRASDSQRLSERVSLGDKQ